jgi:micrococcal nuclease
MLILRILSKNTLLPPVLLFASVLSTTCGRYKEVKENLKFAFPDYVKCDVVKVVDGDTFHCQLSDRQMEKVRLTGIEIPDSIENEATDFTKSYLRRGTPVKLEFDRETRDKFGLTLAYVYLPGDRMLNAILLQEGYAKVIADTPNLKFKDLFLKLEDEARTQGKGLWEKE